LFVSLWQIEMKQKWNSCSMDAYNQTTCTQKEKVYWLQSIIYTKTSAVSEHTHKISHYSIWNEVNFIDWYPHWYTHRIKKAIHIGLHPNNINRDSKSEIPEAWMPRIKIHNKRMGQQRTAKETATFQNNGRIKMHQSQLTFGT